MWVFVVREIAQVYYNARDEGPITNDIARLRKSYGFVEATENTFLCRPTPFAFLDSIHHFRTTAKARSS